MKIVHDIWIGCLLAATTIAAGLQFGAPWPLPPDWVATFGLVPTALMVVVTLWYQRAVPSWLAFACGLIMDTFLDGAIGYWALTYTVCTFFARFLSALLGQQFSIRIFIHALTALGIFVLHLLLSRFGLPYQSDFTDILYASARMFVLGSIIEFTLALGTRLLGRAIR